MQYLRDLSPEDFERFRRRFGGDSIGQVIRAIRIDANGDAEANACDHIAEEFGVRVLTAEERKERREERMAEAAIESTAAASRSAAAAEQANATSTRAFWIAVAALVASIFGLFVGK